MWAEVLVALGIPAGAFIAWRVPDETGWYGSWFSALAAILMLIAGGFAAANAWGNALLFWLAVVAAGLGAYAWPARSAPAATAAATALALLGSIIAWEVLFLSLVLGAGALWNAGRQRSLWWFCAMPIVITVASLL